MGWVRGRWDACLLEPNPEECQALGFDPGQDFLGGDGLYLMAGRP